MKNKLKYKFGEKLRTVRERKGITLKKVAELAELSESLISQIERNLVSPSIDTLLTIADVLGIDHEYLFSDYRKTPQVEIVRADKRTRIVLESSVLHQLSILKDVPEAHDIEAFLLEIAPGKEKGSLEYGHPGKEFGLVLQGTARLIYGTEQYDLNVGDSVSFLSDTPHIFRNTGETTLEAIWIITPPRMIFPKDNR